MLAETLKYLYLLFAEKEDIAIDLDKYIFTTEAHLLPVAMPPPTYTLLPFGDANLDVRPAAPEHDSGCPRQKLTALEELANVIPGLWSRSSATCLRYSDKVRIPPPSYRKGRRGGSARGKLAAVEPYTGPAVPPEQLDVSNSDHVRFLRSINIQLRQQDGVVRLVYQKTDDEGQAEEGAGLLYIQELIKLQQQAVTTPSVHFGILVDSRGH